MSIETGNIPERIKADEPKPNAPPTAAPRGGPSGAEASERADALDEETAGDGVTFFEGGDGREAAQGDIERNG